MDRKNMPGQEVIKTDGQKEYASTVGQQDRWTERI